MPALQFYPADWRKDPAVQSLDYQSRGIWFEMLCLMHESSERGVLLLNGNPMPDEALARSLGLDNQTLKDTLTKILTYGVAKRRESDGAIVSKRMVKDEHLCKVRRESGKLGGNPSLLNQNTTTGVKQVPTPSSSSSSSSSIKAKEQGATPSASPKSDSASRLSKEWVLPQPWGDWALKERSDWNREQVCKVADKFRDYWVSKAGRDAKKIDWQATWRNWVREEKSTKQRSTVHDERANTIAALTGSGSREIDVTPTVG